jgi:hypothetical protein
MIESINNQNSQQPQDKSVPVVNWCVGLFILGLAVCDIRSHQPMGEILCGLLAAGLVLPPIRAITHRVTGLSLSLYLRVTLVIGLWCVAWFLSIPHLKHRVIEPPLVSGVADPGKAGPAAERSPK